MNRTAPVFFITLLFIICVTAAICAAQAAIPDDPLAVSGRWYTEDHEGGIELYPCEAKICGRFYWLRDNGPGNISRDTVNPDTALRGRPLCHMQFMGGFTPEGGGRYTGGWIYSPRDGGIYSAEMTLVSRDTLDLHGYLFFPFLGESRTWKRAKTMPTCFGK